MSTISSQISFKGITCKVSLFLFFIILNISDAYSNTLDISEEYVSKQYSSNSQDGVSNLKTAINSGKFTLFRTGMPDGRAVVLSTSDQNVSSIKEGSVLQLDASKTRTGEFLRNTINITKGSVGNVSLLKANINVDDEREETYNIIAKDNKLTLSGVKATGRVAGIENVSTSSGNTIEFSNLNADTITGIYLHNSIFQDGNAVSAYVSAAGDSIKMNNITTKKAIYGYESTTAYGDITGASILIENFASGDSREGEGNVIGIFAGGGGNTNPSVFRNNKVILLNTTNGDKKSYADIAGIATRFNHLESSNNAVYIGFNPDTATAGYIHAAGVNRRYGSIYGFDIIGKDVNIHDNLVVIGGKKAGNLTHGVNADDRIVGIYAEQSQGNSTINNNNIYIGYTPNEKQLLSVKVNNNLLGVFAFLYNVSPENSNLVIDNNKLFIYGENRIGGDVYGVKADTNFSFDGIYNSTITISNNLLQIGVSSQEKVDSNITTITSDVYGAHITSFANSDIKNNAILIDSSKGNVSLQKALYGAYAFGLNSVISLTGNQVIIKSPTNSVSIGTTIYGGYNSNRSGHDIFKRNLVRLEGNVTTGGEIAGAYAAAQGTFDGNGVEVVGSSTINNNTAKNIYGAYASNYGSVANNYVTLNAGGGIINLKGNLYGAYVHGGTANDKTISGNKVNLVGNVNIDGNSYGAYNNINNGILYENSVILGNGVKETTVTLGNTNNIYGAYANGTGTTLSENFVGINDNVKITNNSFGMYGAYAKGQNASLTNNKIIVGEVEMYTVGKKEPESFTSIPNVSITSKGIYGAYAEGTGSTLENNKVVIASDTDINSSIYGAYAAVSATLTNNLVAIVNNAKVTGSIYGAYAEQGNVSKNTVTLGALAVDRGTINLTGDIYGGYTKNGTATENVVKLNGRNNFQNVNIYGGFSANSQDQVTGNKLLLNKFRGSVGSLQNFEQIEFQRDDEKFTSANAWKEDDVVINIKDGEKTNLNGTKLNNVPNLMADASDKVYKDARMYLMYSENGGLGSLNLGAHQGRLRHGYLRYYDYHIKSDDQSVQIILGKDDGGPVEPPKPSIDPEPAPGDPIPPVTPMPPKPEGPSPIPPRPEGPATDNRPEAEFHISPEAESFLGGRDALAIMIKRGGDMVAAINSNIIHPLEATESEKKYKIGTFLTTGGGYVQDKGKTTEITVSRGATLTGIGANFNQPIADIFLTTFFEGGYGTYTRTGLYDVGEQVNVTADGKLDYYGGGFTLRSDFKVKPAHVVYIDSSFRGGETNYSYKAKNYKDTTNVNAEYKSATAYYGAHLGTGYMYNLNDKYIFDVYAKYLFSYYDDDQVSLSDVEKIDFGSFSSHRLNSGLRVSFTTPVGITPYVGAGFEYQADEGVNAVTFGKAITGHESTLDAMGTFEAGFTYGKQFEKLRLSLDVKGRGTAGALNSGAGSVDIRLDF